MRDLIDGSIVSGTARVFEAILLAAAVAIGVSIGLAIAASAWGPDVAFELPDLPPWAIATQAIAAAITCAAIAVRNEVPRDHIRSIAAVGAVGLVIQRTAMGAGADEVLAATTAAIVIGGLARLLARRHRTSSSIWVAAAILPLVPDACSSRGCSTRPRAAARNSSWRSSSDSGSGSARRSVTSRSRPSAG